VNGQVDGKAACSRAHVLKRWLRFVKDSKKAELVLYVEDWQCFFVHCFANREKAENGRRLSMRIMPAILV
jgi:hypothetical protein